MPGSALGRSIDKMGAAIGRIAGAIAGAVADNKLAEFTEELNPNVGLKLGANNKPVELPRDYSSTLSALFCKLKSLEEVPNRPLPHPLNYPPTKNLDCFPKDHLEVQAQSLKRNIRSNLLPASSHILPSRHLNSGKV
ncbi:MULTISPECIES: hypothetical protein [Brasilonema]|uniref:hypothetical protein n=1 Tax=Brasilonema TaxID=383614 RepID=UPI001B7CDB2B|nr:MULTISPECIES: hypothetical protein [Brasilonema]